jgi:hypothetical protein
MKKFLTETELEHILSIIFPYNTFIRNKTVPNSNLKSRPDFRCDDLMIIVEFDGYLHYSKCNTIISDKIKDKEYSKLGYTIIRIPYFVQISSEVIKQLFNKNIDIIQEYEHGFIDSTAMLPADYCELGLKRFILDLERFNYIKNDIIKSIIDKIKEKGNISLVLPPSLEYLVNK